MKRKERILWNNKEKYKRSIKMDYNKTRLLKNKIVNSKLIDKKRMK